MGARPWMARTQLAYAEMLLARRRRGDKARARELLADAVLTADALGMSVFAQRARDLVPAGTRGRAALWLRDGAAASVANDAGQPPALGPSGSTTRGAEHVAAIAAVDHRRRRRCSVRSDAWSRSTGSLYQGHHHGSEARRGGAVGGSVSGRAEQQDGSA